MPEPNEYTPPAIWTWDKANGGRFASLDRFEARTQVKAALEEADASIIPTVRLTSVESAYWARMGGREFLRSRFELESTQKMERIGLGPIENQHATIDPARLRPSAGTVMREPFRQHLGIKLVVVRAEERFLGALAGKDNPEEKRKIIGHTFIDVFEDAARHVAGDVAFLVQGTLYPEIGRAHV